MSVRRFVGYFFALSACSTIAFASCVMDKPAPQDVAYSAADASAVAIAPVPGKRPPAAPRRSAAPKTTLIARAF